MTEPVLTIVVPTHNRAPVLSRCLSALFRQQALPDGCDVVIVDDGSSDETRDVVRAAQARAPFPVAYVPQDQSGPAAARNRGLRQARGRLVLFLGDDMIAEPTLVEEHLRWHARFPDAATAVLGFVTWAPVLKVTPYMRWLEDSGNQFDYASIRGTEDVDPAKYLYTCNLSMKRAFLLDADEWFDERFRHALLEDIDLGRRLAARGLRLRYDPAAVAYHEHAVTLTGYARRIELSSEYLVLLESKRTNAPGATPGAADVVPRAPGTRRDHAAYGWFLLRVCGEIVRTWPSWWIARYFERRRMVPDVFVRAHRHWAHRGLLRLEARRAFRKIVRAA